MRRCSASMKRRPFRPSTARTPGRAERHGFEYFRHGTLSLYAAFNTKTGEVLGKTAERHTSAEFVAFLTDIVANQPKGKEIDRKSTRLNSSHLVISYAVFCLKKKKKV